MDSYTARMGKKATQGSVTNRDVIHLLILLAYAAVEFFPYRMEVIDNVGVHWWYLSIVNIAAAAYLVVRKEFSIASLKNPLAYAWFAFCGLAALSVLPAYNKVEWLVSFSRLLTTTIMFVNCSVMLNNNRRLFRQAILLLIVSGSVQAAIVIFNFLQGAAVETITLGLGNKNILAASLMVKLAFAMMSVNAATRLLRWFILAGMGLLVAATYVLAARTAIFGMFILVVFYIITTLATKRAKNVRSALFITLVVFGAVSVQVELWSRVATNMYNKQTVAERVISIREEVVIPKKFSRAVLWGFAVDYAAHHPLLGGGLGNWKINSIPYEKKVLTNDYHSKHAHNDILEIAADTGIPGALAYLSLFGVCGWFLVRIIKTREMKGYDMLFAVPAAGMIAYLCDATFNFPLERANMQVLFAITLALNHSNYQHFFPTENFQPENPLARRSAAAALLLAAIVVLPVSWKDFRSMQGQFIILGWAPKNRYNSLVIEKQPSDS
jgi:O-antigen ligase